MQDVEAAQLRGRKLNHPFDVFGVADIGQVKLRSAAGFANFGDHRIAALIVDIDHYHRRTLACECPRGGRANPRTAAGN